MKTCCASIGEVAMVSTGWAQGDPKVVFESMIVNVKVSTSSIIAKLREQRIDFDGKRINSVVLGPELLVLTLYQNQQVGHKQLLR